MIVFSNTTPIIALSGVARLEVLPRLFRRIRVVEEVVAECSAGGPIPVPDLTRVTWIDVVRSTPVLHSNILLELDQGEKHTLDMALKLKADWVIIDEKIGRNVAEYLGLRVIGTLGVLLKAKQLGLIPSFRETVAEMQAQGIRYHAGLVEKLAALAGE